MCTKDVRLGLELAHDVGVPVPMAECVGRDGEETLKRGWGQLDLDVIVRIQEERAGVILQLDEKDLPPPRSE